MSVGEILDRAISTFVRRFIPVFAIIAIAAIPTALLQLTAEPALAHLNDLVGQLSRLPPGDTYGRNHLLLYGFSDVNFGSIAAVFLIGPIVLYPFARTALIVYANAAVAGVPVTIAAAFRPALARWLPQNIVALTFVVFGTVAFVVIVVFLAVLLLLITVAAGGRNAIVGTGAIIVGVPCLFAAIVAYALLNVAWELASISVAIEDPNPFRAIGHGLRRTFDRQLRRRTLGVALAYVAIELIGTAALAGAGALLATLTHVRVVNDLATAIAQIVIIGVLAMFMVAYARDVRLRREGLDLLLAARDGTPP
jgi:hypothetical protein